MPSNPIKVAGQITLATLKPLPNLKVELLDSQVNGQGWLGSTSTDENGRFVFVLNDPIASLVVDGTITLKYKVYKDGNTVQENDILDYTAIIHAQLPVSAFDAIYVDNTPPVIVPTIPAFIKITGVVSDGNSVGLKNLTVNVYEIVFREPPFLIGSCITDDQGMYYTVLHSKLLTNSAISNIKTIKVEVFDLTPALVCKSDEIIVRENAITVNLTANILSAQTEFQKISAKIQAIVGTSNLIADVDISANNDEVKYIAKISDLEEVTVRNVVNAHKKANNTPLNADIVYALMKEKGNDPQSLYHTQETFDTGIIQKAIEKNEISNYSPTQLEGFFTDFKADQVATTKEIPIKDETYSFNDVMHAIVPGADAPTRQAKIDDFLALYHESHESLDALWAAHTTANGGDPTLSKKIQLGLKLASITHFQPEMISKLTDVLGNNPINHLAKLDIDTWKNTIAEVCDDTSTLCVPAKIRGQETDPTNTQIHAAYAETMMGIAKAVFPLAHISGQLAAPVGSSLIPDGTIRGHVATFIDNNPSFDPRLHSVNDINDTDFVIPEGADIADIKSAMAPIQRVMRITGSNPDATIALLKDGIKSSNDLVAMGYENFIATYGNYFPEEPVEDELVPNYLPRAGTAGSAPVNKQTAIQSYNVAVTVNKSATSSAVNAINSALMANLNTVAAGTLEQLPAVFRGGFVSSPTDDPVLSQLFGSMDYADCPDCKSMVGPGAYLTDLLHFLKTNAPDVYTALLDKRPDITNIDLTCKNTNTPLPYIDLVIELLELSILKPDASVLPPTHLNGTTPAVDFKKFSFQTNGTEAQVASYPEHIYKDTSGVYQDFRDYSSGASFNRVYDGNNLGGAIYPTNLPYNLAIEESRAYLSLFGTSRYELMKLFRPYNQAAVTGYVPTDSITDYSLFAEWLGVSVASANIITGNNGYGTYAFYGAASTNVSFPDPQTNAPMTAANWEDALSARIDVLLQQTGITYDELLQCLTTRYLNPMNSSNLRLITITNVDGALDNTSKLNELKLVFTDTGTTVKDTFYNKLHRFIRLIKTDKFSIYKWDIILSSLGITNISVSNFQQLGQVILLADELNISPEILACWWSNMDTNKYFDFPHGSTDMLPSVYELVFNNLGGANNVTTNALINPASLPTSYKPTLSGATVSIVAQIANSIGISETDVVLLINFLYNGTPDLSATAVTLATLSRLYVLSKLSKAWGYTITEFVTILYYCNDIPGATRNITLSASNNPSVTTFTAGTLAEYIANLKYLCDLMRAIRNSGFSVTELNHLVGIPPFLYVNDPYAPNPLKIQQFFEKLRGDLVKKELYNPSSPDTILRDVLKNIIHQQFAKEFNLSLQIVIDVFSASTFTVDILDNYFVKSTYVLTETNITNIDSLTITAGTAIDTSSLITAAESSNTGNVKPGIRLGLLYKWYRYFEKISMICRKLNLKLNDFEYLFYCGNAAGFYFNQLPVEGGYGFAVASGSTTPALSPKPVIALNNFLRVCRASQIVDRLQMEDGTLGTLSDLARGILYSATPVSYANQTFTPISSGATNYQTTMCSCLVKWNSIINQATNDVRVWDLVGDFVPSTTPVTVISSSLASALLNVKFTTDIAVSNFTINNYDNINMVFKLLDILDICKKVGLNPATVQRMLVEGVTLNDSRNLMVSAKGKYDDDSWVSIAKPLRDVIRVKQRDALVSYTKTKTNVLFADLLIDTQMDACMTTSRIKQAISSVQLLVDRVVLGVEYKTNTTNKVTMPSYVADQWQRWRKWLVIWQANRKVFLYPENWMEPSLRDDKSPFFTELESRLRQDELTYGSAENAIVNYLHKVDEVASLEPVGCCDTTEGGLPTTYVFARTHSSPHKYYYRTLCNGIWTYWKKVDIDIAGDHVIPAVKYGRVHLFWITFAEKIAQSDDTVRVRTMANTSVFPWFWNPQGETCNDVGDVAGSDTGIKYKQLTITLNWTELKEGNWQNLRSSKEKVTLKIHSGFDQNLLHRYADNRFRSDSQEYKDTILFLLHNNELSPTDLVKSKIFLATAQESNGDFCVKLLFPQGTMISAPGFRPGSSDNSLCKEDGFISYLHGFRFKKGVTAPDTIRFNFGGYNRNYINTPLNTLLKNMKFLENNISNGGTDKALSTFSSFPLYSSTNNHYNYATESLDSVTYYKGNGEVKILNSTADNGSFKLTLKSFTTAEYGTEPLLDKFFFEDDVNKYFVQKVPTDYAVNPFNVMGINTANDNAAYFYGGSGGGAGAHVTGGLVPHISAGSYASAGSAPMDNAATSVATIPQKYVFHTFTHPRINDFIQSVNAYGVVGLYRPDIVANPIDCQSQTDTMQFASKYSPVNTVDTSDFVPKNLVDFGYRGTYSSYNWEIFYHIPMLIAERLSDEQRFLEAQKWYHFIFDPTSPSSGGNPAQRSWKFRPFYDLAGGTIDTLDQLLQNVHNGTAEANAQLNQSNANPFEPYAVARIRKSAFMKNVIMKYLDNLIAWGDNLFMRDTLESINEATQLYIMASNILGPKPVHTPVRGVSKAYSFRQLDETGNVDGLGDAVVSMETCIAPNAGLTIPANVSVVGGYTKSGSPTSPKSVYIPTMTYFCLAPNDKMLEYWAKIEDRLFKIRHCQNIAGIVQKLPLFDPPIDPALLVQAAAAGIDMNSVLNSSSGMNTPHYRFTFMLQKANEFCNDVKALGSALLSALEKKDAEALSLLRQGHEMMVQDAMVAIKKNQLDEAGANLESSNKALENANLKRKYYSSRPYMNSSEKDYFISLKVGMALQAAQAIMQSAAGTGHLVPTVHAQGVATGASQGGQHVGNSLQQFAAALGTAAAINSTIGIMASTRGGFDRRKDDWDFQKDCAEIEIKQVEKQILAATIRVEIAQMEYDNQVNQLQNSKDVDTFMRSKYTNEELYDWMIGQISDTYFQSYQLALKMAQRAELCYEREIGAASTSTKPTFIAQKYWDSLRKGLLAGEHLQADLRNMEAAYINANRRLFELTKHVSLAMLNPIELAKLKSTGTCTINIPEEFYDLDYPDHYNRIIKSVSISIPCVAGPYTTVPCTLTHSNSYIRKKNTTGSDAFSGVTNLPCPSIATSSAQNDNGVFDFNFRDERYLPFEGAGAICQFTLKLGGLGSGGSNVRPFDFDSINDVIIHVKYTSLADTSFDRSANVLTKIQNTILGTYPYNNSTSPSTLGSAGIKLPRVFSLKHEFPNGWFDYANGYTSTNGKAIEAVVLTDQFPFFKKGRKITITRLDFRIIKKVPSTGTPPTYTLQYSIGTGSFTDVTINATTEVGNTASLPTIELTGTAPSQAMTFRLKNGSAYENIDTLLDDILIVATYQVGF